MRLFRSSGSLRARALVPLVAALLVWTSITSVVTAAADKSFNATISPIALAAGGSYGVAPRDPIILTITNTSNQAQMGSANVTLPAGLKLTDATATSGTATATPNLTTNTVELRNLGLQPGGFVTASVSAQVECASNHSPYVWSFEVKQANDFNGTPGNDLAPDGDVTSTVTGHCGLSFTKQPKSEEKNVTITNKIYDIGTPHGDPVTVSVVDSEGSAVPWWSGTMAIAMGSNPGSATLGGTLTGSTINGSVTFAPTIGTSATGYTLAATAVATAGTPSAGISGSPVSDAFTIVDDATICLTAGSSCMVTASGPSHGNAVSTQATVTAGAVSGPNPIGGANDPGHPPGRGPGHQRFQLPGLRHDHRRDRLQRDAFRRSVPGLSCEDIAGHAVRSVRHQERLEIRRLLQILPRCGLHAERRRPDGHDWSPAELRREESSRTVCRLAGGGQAEERHPDRAIASGRSRAEVVGRRVARGVACDRRPSG